MSFSSDLRRFALTVQTRRQDIFVNTVSHVRESIVEGSPVTGAPGQPVDTGNLRDSWQETFEGPTTALVSTNVEYAEDVEDNVRGVTFHNHGPHSVKLTRQHFDRIVAVETVKAGGTP